MNKKKLVSLILPIKKFLLTFPEFLSFLYSYLKSKTIDFSLLFEANKNILVRFFTMKRGRYSRPFLHFATMGVLTIGVIVAPFLASTYPIFSQNSTTAAKIASSAQAQSIIVGENLFQTDISQKPRDKIISYTVQKGDAISNIAQKFGISAETIKWQNNLTGDYLSIGDELEILPVTGIAYKVQSGDSVYTIAKKFDTEAQKIVDFPFNDFANPETFSLVNGQILIIPDGIKPSEQPTYIRKQIFIAEGPISVSSAGFTWPMRGGISQFASWYHMALDITDPVGTPVVAAQDGTVSMVSIGGWDNGYGTNIYIDGGNGYKTHYAHMSSISVSVGQRVIAGKTVIGYSGNTGRSTGPHLHFEVIRNGVLVNPLSYIQ
nr:peptidoglycan DD-metalloendopeptidase family protein [Candidatus Levybacteria bacterium]